MSEAANYLPKVREQYEEFPYPERDPEDEKTRLITPYLSRMDAVNHHCFRGEQNFKNFRVLVAGGGTGDNLISWAEQLRHKEGSSVTYLDMSTASAAIAKKRAKIRGLDNITWINDSILNIPDLKIGPFDFVECNGVLHHLKDPDAGLKALVSVLKPGGAMNLMVYATYGRTGVYMVQDLMRLINGEEKNPRIKINNTKKALEILPPHHWFKASQNLGWAYSDAKNDAGIYDLFLHSQDRPFTILEVHDWLERCGLKMSSEPGYCYSQVGYLPETYIKDKNLLEIINEYPLKIRQAIAEAASTKISKHEFYAVHKDAGETVAKVSDTRLVPWGGMLSHTTFDNLAAMSLQNAGSFVVKFDKLPEYTKVYVPGGKFMHAILRRIDGQRTIAEIVSEIRNDPKYTGTPPAEDAILRDFEDLVVSLSRGHALYLRHKSVEPFPTVKELNDQMLKKG